MQWSRVSLGFFAACAWPGAQNPPAWQDLIQQANQAQSEGRDRDADALIRKAWADVQTEGAAAEGFADGVQAVVNFLIGSGHDLSANSILHAAENAADALPPNHPGRFNVLVLRAQTLGSEQRRVEAEQVYEQVLAAQTKLGGSDSAEVGQTLRTIATLYDQSGDLDKAEAIARRVESTTFRQQPMSGRTFGSGVVGGVITTVYSGRWFSRSIVSAFGEEMLGNFYERHGRFAEAEQAYLAAIERAKQSSEEPGLFSNALRSYAQFLRNRRRFPEAEQLQLQIIDMNRAANPDAPSATVGERENLAAIYADAGNFEAANETYDNLRSEFLNMGSAGVPEYRGIQQNYVWMLTRQQKFDQAEQVAQDLLENSAADNSDGTRQNALSTLSQIRQQRGDTDGALRYQQQANEVGAAQQNAWDPEGIGAEIEHAGALVQQARIAEACVLIAHAQSAAENGDAAHASNFLTQIANVASSFPEKEQERADEIVHRAAVAYSERVSALSPMYNPWSFLSYESGHGQWGEAERLLDSWLTAIESANGPDSPRLIQPLQNAANLYSEQNQPEQSLRLLLRALEIAERTDGANSREVENLLWPLTSGYMNVNQWPRAIEIFGRLLATSRLLDGPTIGYANTLNNASGAFSFHGQYDCAMAFLARAIEIARVEDPATVPVYEQNLESNRNQKFAALKQNQSAEAGVCPAI